MNLHTEKDDKPAEISKYIQENLLDNRTILISEGITSKLSERVISQLLVLNYKDSKTPVKIFLNTPGGGADDGFAILDMIRFVNCPVYTISAGLTASAGVLILLAAEKDKRLCLPNSRIMMHQPSTETQGMASDISITAQEIIKLRQRANKLISSQTGQAVKKIEKDTERDFWMSPEEAVNYGLVGRIVKNISEI